MDSPRAASRRPAVAQLAVAGRALAFGARLVPLAIHRAGAVLALSTVGAILAFVAEHAAPGSRAGVAMRVAGWLLLALMLPAKLGALYRLATGETAGLEAGGLQWRRLDGRLAVTAAALIAFAGFILAGAAVAAALLPPPLGALALAPFAGVAVALCACGLGRLALVLPAEATSPQPRFAAGLLASRGHDLAAAVVFLAAFALPTLAWLALALALDRLETARGWPPAEALLAGVALGGLASFVAAPFLAGALSALHREVGGAVPLARGAGAGEAGGLGHTAPREPCAP